MNGNIEDRSAWFATLRGSAQTSCKNWWVTLALSLFTGFCGADRFYLGSPVLGWLKLVSFGGVWIWWLSDFLLVLAGRMRDGDGRFVRRY